MCVLVLIIWIAVSLKNSNFINYSNIKYEFSYYDFVKWDLIDWLADCELNIEGGINVDDTEGDEDERN